MSFISLNTSLLNFSLLHVSLLHLSAQMHPLSETHPTISPSVVGRMCMAVELEADTYREDRRSKSGVLIQFHSNLHPA
jgi:hypothetical protein